MVESLFRYYLAHPEEMGEGSDDVVTRATDWVSGMTDRYCIRVYGDLIAA